jgi:hypothetical protein
MFVGLLVAGEVIVKMVVTLADASETVRTSMFTFIRNHMDLLHNNNQALQFIHNLYSAHIHRHPDSRTWTEEGEHKWRDSTSFSETLDLEAATLSSLLLLFYHYLLLALFFFFVISVSVSIFAFVSMCLLGYRLPRFFSSTSVSLTIVASCVGLLILMETSAPKEFLLGMCG